MFNVEPLTWVLFAAFTAALGTGIFFIVPDTQRIQSWFEKFNERQKLHLEQSISESTKPDSIASKLQRAGINIYPWVFHVFCVVCAVVVAFVVGNYTKNVVAGLLMSLFGYRFPIFVLNMINKSYDKKMDVQIGLLVSSTAQTILASGSMLKTIESIARVVDDPLRSELQKILGAYRLGRPLERGFIELANKTGHTELLTYARIVNMAQVQGTSAAADAFRRLHKLVEQQESLEQDRRAQLSEYTMFVSGVVFGLPIIYFIACNSSQIVYNSMIHWFPGKVATAAIAFLIVASYLGYKLSTRSVN